MRLDGKTNHFERADGSPLFLLADTAWELLHRLSRAEVSHYLERRAEQGFRAVLTVLLAELDGLRVPNAEGQLPLVDQDPSRLNASYLEFVDWVLERAEALGLVVGLLPTWGDKFHLKWGPGPEIFTASTARVFGRALGARWADRDLFWVLGGDRALERSEHLRIVRAMAEGIRDAGANQLMTFHPCGGRSSSCYVQGEAWLDFNMLQSGHCGRDIANWDMIALDRERLPSLPVLDGEPGYEDHPVMSPSWEQTGGWFDDHDCRKAGYRAALIGACGHVYGHHAVWQMWTPERGEGKSHVRTPWQEALDHPGARQMRFLSEAMERWPILWGPDGVLDLDVEGVASDDPGRHGIVSPGGRPWRVAYLPTERPLRLTLRRSAGPVWLRWFCPSTGRIVDDGKLAIGAVRVVQPPCRPDSLMVVEDEG
ncbi:apiosidase-like domain-containing protein [Mucisphaera calidilacus]|uniref:Endoglucanase n=1 Tax=Mucisphaera calidilacus TaxID=2527982 RepID=A0A518BX13_9BACT|nr:DUF4038 domain-containing protein [Mucisphaera calidilacus]QDU71517.1 Putative endoglucanase [Mucisphaera calidilacus]